MDIQKAYSKSFYKNEKNARQYIESTEGLDGRFLIKILKKHLKPNATVLELGMGAGKDLDILNETFNATGSDYSQAFLDIYKQRNPNANLLLLDARTLETDIKFDCIFSNKVLHHLSKKELKNSLRKQKKILNKNGIIFHTFWRGKKENVYNDLHFIQYELDELIDVNEKDFILLKIKTYKEMISNDSIYLISKQE